MNGQSKRVMIQELVTGTLPKKAYLDDAAYDLYSAEDIDYHNYTPTTIVDVFIGFRMELPKDVAALILPRSSTSSKYGIWIPNAPGLIDPGFRGDMKVRTMTINPAPAGASYNIKKGDRIAQLLFVPVADIIFETTIELQKSYRGPAGWGSSE